MAAPLVAGLGSFALSGGAFASGFYAATGAMVLTAPPATFGRDYTVDLGSLDLKLAALQASISIVDAQGRPSAQFQLFWQRHCEAIRASFRSLVDSVTAIQTAYDAAAQAQAAAESAHTAVAAAQEVAQEAQEVVTQLQSGELNLPAITIGGKKYVGGEDDSLVAQ